MKFAPEYIENVLSENFEDFKKFFFHALMDIHFAHLVMLNETKILDDKDARALVKGLDSIDPRSVQSLVYDGSYEDLFFLVESLLDTACGSETAGRLHTARSRNDVDVTLYRLRWRLDVLQLQQAALGLRRVLSSVAERERDTLFPMYTHAQAAQPSTLAHYFLGVIEHLERDSRRFRAALETMNHCPLGSCAITGTSFPIDRELTSRLLAFDAPTGNTHGSIAAADYVLQAVSSVTIMATNLTRVLQDLLLWSTTQFRFLRLSDEYVQPSSIMPQKRNPVALEHSRAILSRCMGEASAVFQMIHNTPFGDIVDIEDDLQPLVNRVFRDSIGPVRVLSGAIAKARFDRDRLARAASENQITMTELADTLVRREGLSFRMAHSITSRLAQREPAGDNTLSQALLEASREICGRGITIPDEELAAILHPRNFVQQRRTEGGPAPERISEALSRAEESIAEDERWSRELEARFASFGEALRARARRI